MINLTHVYTAKMSIKAEKYIDISENVISNLVYMLSFYVCLSVILKPGDKSNEC